MSIDKCHWCSGDVETFREENEELQEKIGRLENHIIGSDKIIAEMKEQAAKSADLSGVNYDR